MLGNHIVELPLHSVLAEVLGDFCSPPVQDGCWLILIALVLCVGGEVAR